MACRLAPKLETLMCWGYKWPGLGPVLRRVTEQIWWIPSEDVAD